MTTITNLKSNKTTTMKPVARRLASSEFAAAFMGSIVLLGLGMMLTGHWILLSSSQEGRSSRDAATSMTTNWLQQGWRAPLNAASTHNERTAQRSVDLDDAPFDWNASQYTDRCLYVEDVCHSAHRFFYHTSKSSSSSSTASETKRRHQPPLILETKSSDEWPPNQRETVYRRYYRFREPSDSTALGQCSWSPITNHVRLSKTFALPVRLPLPSFASAPFFTNIPLRLAPLHPWTLRPLRSSFCLGRTT
jgi:hypothetical protein